MFFMGFKAPTSTLLLLVPSAESFRAVRNLYQQQGQDVGQKKLVGDFRADIQAIYAAWYCPIRFSLLPCVII